MRSKARLDVALDDPLVVGVSLTEVDDLGDGVLGSPPRPVAVGRRVEVGFEDRFQHQLEGHLDHAVPKGGNPQIAELAAPLGDGPFPCWQRPERPGFELTSQLAQEPFHSVALHVAAGGAIHPRGA